MNRNPRDNTSAPKTETFWSPKRVIFLGLAICLLVFGIESIRSAIKYADKNRLAAHAEPLRMTVDLSRVATYTGSLHQVASHTCKQVLAFDGGLNQADNATLQTFLNGLRGRLVIARPSGETVLDRAFDSESFLATLSVSTNVPWMVGVPFSPFTQGDYLVKLAVDHEAPSMAGKEQHLISRYELCGLEDFTVRVFAGMATASLFLSSLCFYPAGRFMFLSIQTGRRIALDQPKTASETRGGPA
jgi:hypothetical protein